MLDLCKGCKCNAVCSYKDELEALNKQQQCEMSVELAKIIKYGITYTCACRIREKNGKKG